MELGSWQRLILMRFTFCFQLAAQESTDLWDEAKIGELIINQRWACSKTELGWFGGQKLSFLTISFWDSDRKEKETWGRRGSSILTPTSLWRRISSIAGTSDAQFCSQTENRLRLMFLIPACFCSVFTGSGPNCTASLRAWCEEPRRGRCLERKCRRKKGKPEDQVHIEQTLNIMCCDLICNMMKGSHTLDVCDGVFTKVMFLSLNGAVFKKLWL